MLSGAYVGHAPKRYLLHSRFRGYGLENHHLEYRYGHQNQAASRYRPRTMLVGHLDTVTAMAYDLKKMHLWSVSADRTVRIWDWFNGK